MDIRLPQARPTLEEREAIDRVLGEPSSSWDGAETRSDLDHRVAFGGAAKRAERHRLLPCLHALQDRVGWISEGGLAYVCERLAIAPAEAWSVATFYALFATEPRPRRVVHVCDDIGCRAKGARELCATLERELGAPLGSTHAPDHRAARDEVPNDAERVGWARSPCLGLCDHAPAALVTEAGVEPIALSAGPVDAARVRELVAAPLSSTGARDASDRRSRDDAPPPPAARLLARVGVVDPESFADYLAHGGYRALERALELGPDRVIAEVHASKLVGRGGAAFPTGRKWEAVKKEPASDRYLVCNADESEPGTFKDRVLLVSDPFAIVEAMTIAAYASGCSKGFLYVRAEYPLAAERIENACRAARAAKLLGANIGGRGFDFDIEVRRGAGAYICGEETALFESIEGRRGEPRSKPPFPVQSGLFGKPTVVNNVETLANVLPILTLGGAEYAKLGTAQSTGTRLFCLSGNVRRPGVYEVACGTKLATLLELAGGVPAGRKLQAILLGGAAGGFVRPDELDLELSLEAARAAGTTLGSGVVMVFDDTADLRDAVARIARFFREESCGQCVPCRVGTVRQEEALARIGCGKTRGTKDDELALLDEIGAGMKDASICGLGQTAYAAVESAIKRLKLFGEPPQAFALAPSASAAAAAPSASAGTANAGSGTISFSLDGRAVTVKPGTTILQAAREHGVDVPTLCYLETLAPANACRLCVVEIEGARVLAPSCSRAVEPGMKVHTSSPRVRHARKLVLELLASSVDLSTAPELQKRIAEYGADPARFGAPQAAHDRDHTHAGHHAEALIERAASVAQPVKVDNELYVRDYAKCVLCYKCVEACGEDHQNTFAIGVAGRGFDARISTEFDVALPDSACVYCGNCIAVCPTGALMASDEHALRARGAYDESKQTAVDTICPYCGVGCTLRLHAQEGKLFKATSPLSNRITLGNLCIKGRFGWRFVQPRE
jgi:NADH-quinone oxidoreductase subunit F